jgi:hypothetical protein
LDRQLERNSVTTNNAVEFMWEAGKQVDRLWVYQFAERNKDKIAVHETVLMEKERHEVSMDDLEGYFETVNMHLKDAPPLFV